MAEIVQYILHDGRGDFDRAFMTAFLEITPPDDESKMDSSRTPGYQICAAMKSPRCIISHCPESLRPPQLMTKKAKVNDNYCCVWAGARATERNNCNQTKPFEESHHKQ